MLKSDIFEINIDSYIETDRLALQLQTMRIN